MTLLFPSGKSVKDKIILTLGYTWPLKPKEILSYIKHNFNANVTYQAVYKSINELIEEGVIVKQDKGFMLSREWVGSLRDYTNYVDQSYKSGIPKKDIIGSEQLTLDSIWDWYYYVLVTMEKLAKDEYATKTPVVIRGTHEWNALVIGKEELWRALKVLKKYSIYTMVLIDNPLAEDMTKYWERLGINIVRANKANFVESSNDVVVIGDYVIQAMFPKELIEGLHKFYDSANTVDKIDVAKLQLDIFYKKAGIHIIAVKNKVLADKLRKETLEFFKKKK